METGDSNEVLLCLDNGTVLSPIWKGILKAAYWVERDLIIRTGNGQDTFFWWEKWAADFNLKDKSLNIFNVVVYK